MFWAILWAFGFKAKCCDDSHKIFTLKFNIGLNNQNVAKISNPLKKLQKLPWKRYNVEDFRTQN